MKKKQLTYNNEPGFKVPEKYFEDFEGRLFSKLSRKQLLNEKLETGFEVPKNYFKKFDMDLPSKKETKVITLFSKRNLKLATSIAAMLIFVLSVFNDDGNKEISFSTIGYETVESYLQNDNVNFNNLEIERIITNGSNASEIEFKKIDEEALFDYLMNASTELSLINR